MTDNPNKMSNDEIFDKYILNQRESAQRDKEEKKIQKAKEATIKAAVKAALIQRDLARKLRKALKKGDGKLITVIKQQQKENDLVLKSKKEIAAKIREENKEKTKKNVAKEKEKAIHDLVFSASKDKESKGTLITTKIGFKLEQARLGAELKILKLSRKFAKDQNHSDEVQSNAEELRADVDLTIKSIAVSKSVTEKVKKLKELGETRESINQIIKGLEEAEYSESDIKKMKEKGDSLDKDYVGLDAEEILKKVNAKPSAGTKQTSPVVPTPVVPTPVVPTPVVPTIQPYPQGVKIDSNFINEELYNFLIKNGQKKLAEKFLDALTDPKMSKTSDIKDQTKAIKKLSKINEQIAITLDKMEAESVDEQDTSVEKQTPKLTQKTSAVPFMKPKAKAEAPAVSGGGGGGLISMLPGLLMGGGGAALSALGPALAVAATAYLGYKAGTWISDKMTEHNVGGGALYDKLHPENKGLSAQQKAIADKHGYKGNDPDELNKFLREKGSAKRAQATEGTPIERAPAPSTPSKTESAVSVAADVPVTTTSTTKSTGGTTPTLVSSGTPKSEDTKPKKVSSNAGKQAMIKAMDDKKITDQTQRAAIMAQVAHESAGFTTLSENLNYKPSTLEKVFPKYFKSGDAADVAAEGPQAIAERVYSKRMGNGPEGSGDGYNFRGRGFIQLTGKENYTKFGYASDPDKLLNPKDAAESAIKYMEGYKGDWNNITGVTKFVNGGTIGLEDRKSLFQGMFNDPEVAGSNKPLAGGNEDGDALTTNNISAPTPNKVASAQVVEQSTASAIGSTKKSETVSAPQGTVNINNSTVNTKPEDNESVFSLFFNLQRA